MWIITGPFDSEQPSDQTPDKTKLLKPNRVYGIGRHKDSALTINNKKISRQNGEFIVGEHLVDDVIIDRRVYLQSNAASVPALSFRNTKSTSVKVSRGESVFIVNPQSTYELESGDLVRLAGNINATVIWDQKICFYTPSDDLPAFDVAACAAMGVKLVTKHTRDITHHITANITAPLHSTMLLSLLNPASLVNPQWLVELLHRGYDAAGLETYYDLPLENSYLPHIDPTVSEKHPSMVKTESWKPSVNRKALFDDVRIIFAVIGSGIGSSTKAMADVVTRGGADRQLVNVEREAEEIAKGASGSWVTVLKKRKVVLKEGMRSGLVLVGDAEAMTARGVPRDIRKTWENLVEKARSANMRVINPSLITEAILKADVSLLDCAIDGDNEPDVTAESSNPKPLPKFVPSTLPEETSQLPGTDVAPESSNPDDTGQPASQAAEAPVSGRTRRLTRRSASQTPAPDPTPPVAPMEIEETSQSAPKRLLKRRARTGGLVNQLLGLDDTTVLEESQPSREQSVQPEVVPATPARLGRLKRRAGTAAASQLIPEFQPSPVGKHEPTLKKFKALFEESGQGNITSQMEDLESSAGGSGGIADTQLPIVVEEEEEEVSQAQSQARKRKASAMEGEAETTGDAEGPQVTKKRAVEAVTAVERSQKPGSQAATDSNPRTTVVQVDARNAKKGAVPGKPDTDPSFLRAIASNKRGKRLEDDFDREFNQLRIAKPVVDNADANVSKNAQGGREWDGLDDFERDAGIRGNFMQIVELKVWKDDQEQPGVNVRREAGLGARLDWDGRADFKKFRRKQSASAREVVKLVLSEQLDDESEAPRFNYGDNKPGRGFDDMSQAQSQSQSQSYPIFTQTPSAPRSRSKPQSKAKARPKSSHEVVDEDDDEVEAEIGGFETQSKGRSQASGRGKASQRGKTKQPLFDDDSEDEDLPPPQEPSDETLRGDSSLPPRSSKGTMQTRDTKPRTTRATKRKIALVEDSDSDQGLTFGGFSKKVKRK